MFTRCSPSPRPGPSSRWSPSLAPCSVRSFRGELAGPGRGGRGLAASRGRCVGCEPVTSHLCSGAALEGHRPGPVGEFLVSALSTGVFVPRSPTHAPWLLAHKIQSPQEREALHALTVSLPRASGRCPEPGRAGPAPFPCGGRLRFLLAAHEKAGRGEPGLRCLPRSPWGAAPSPLRGGRGRFCAFRPLWTRAGEIRAQGPDQ